MVLIRLGFALVGSGLAEAPVSARGWRAIVATTASRAAAMKPSPIVPCDATHSPIAGPRPIPRYTAIEKYDTASPRRWSGASSVTIVAAPVKNHACPAPVSNRVAISTARFGTAHSGNESAVMAAPAVITNRRPRAFANRATDGSTPTAETASDATTSPTTRSSWPNESLTNRGRRGATAPTARKFAHPQTHSSAKPRVSNRSFSPWNVRADPLELTNLTLSSS